MKPKEFKKVHITKVDKQISHFLKMAKDQIYNEHNIFAKINPFTINPVRAELYLDFQ